MESDAEINWLLIETVICEPCDEERAETMKDKEYEAYDNRDDDTMSILLNK